MGSYAIKRRAAMHAGLLRSALTHHLLPKEPRRDTQIPVSVRWARVPTTVRDARLLRRRNYTVSFPAYAGTDCVHNKGMARFSWSMWLAGSTARRLPIRALTGLDVAQLCWPIEVSALPLRQIAITNYISLFYHQMVPHTK